MIVTPHQLDLRSQFYRQLAQMTESGLGLQKSLQSVASHSGDRGLREAIQSIDRKLLQGSTFGDALLSTGKWLPAFDIALMGAGEQSGRLPACFHKLSSYYEERARLLRRMLASLAYPIFLVHVAVLVFPVSSLQALVLKGEITSFIFSKMALILPLYVIIGIAAYVAQGSRGELFRAALDRVLAMVPVLGKARRSMAMSRLCLALEALINSGTGIIRAWELSAAACGSPIIESAVKRFLPAMEAGTVPSELVSKAGVFPDEFMMQYHTAEMSGKLDETLARMHRFYVEAGTRQSQTVVILFGGLIFGVVILAVAWQIISFWMGYFQQIQDVIPQ